jgi:hypothetical protein
LRDLATGRIKPGDSVEALIASHPPCRVRRHGQFVDVWYGPPDSLGGTFIVAMDDRIIAAGDSWMCDGHLFFDTFTPDQNAAYGMSRNEYYENQAMAIWSVAGTMSAGR